MGLNRRDDLVLLNGLRRSFAERRAEHVLVAIDSLIAELTADEDADSPLRASVLHETTRAHASESSRRLSRKPSVQTHRRG